VKLPLIFLAICYAVLFTCLYLTMGDLPARIATHFDITGQPNGWMSRTFYLGFTLALAVGLPLFLIATTSFSARLPGSFRRIPNREYWMAPERRTATIAVFRRFITGMGCLLVLLVTGIHLLLIDANRNPAQPHLSSTGIWTLAAGFLVASLAWSWTLRRKFSKIG
jgi:uncharacterized membrane protein